MRRAAFLLALLALSAGLAGCGGGEEVSPTPETVVGHAADGDDRRGGDDSAGVDHPGRCRRTGPRCSPRPAAAAATRWRRPARRGNVGPNLDDSQPDSGLVVERVTNGQGAMPAFSDSLSEQRDRRRRRVRLRVDALRLPDGFPRDVAAIACDLDRTLTWEDGVLRPRTSAALRAARAAGIHVVIATGRMFRSVRPYARASSGSTRRSSATRAQPSSTRRRAIGSCTSRSRSRSPARRSGPSRTRASRSTATSTTISTSPRSPSAPAPTPTSRASRCTRSATSSTGSSGRRRSSSSSTNPATSTSSGRSSRTTSATASSSPSRCRTSSSSRARRSRRAAASRSCPSSSASRPSARSRSATARTISSCSSGPASASRSRTRTRA